jgi:hypothetical protein
MFKTSMKRLGLAATLLSLATVAAAHERTVSTNGGLMLASADDRDHDRDRDGRTVECASQDFKYRRCPVPWRHAVLIDQLSDTDCVEGRTWGMDRDGLWVDQGCAGRFGPARDHDRDRDHDRNDRVAGGDPAQVTCESQGGDQHRCRLPFPARNVRMDRQLSDSNCERGRSWDWDRDEIWVREGCRAEFSVWPR